MRVGFTTMNGLDDVPPDRLARELDDRGFDSLWTGEHPQIPAARRTPYPAGGELPPAYTTMMDPFLSLLVAAREVPTLVVGTSVALPLERELFTLAKSVATIDHLTGGRFCFGVGVGWNVEELAVARGQLPWAARYRALDDQVAALKALWVDDPSEHHGPFFDFEPVRARPKPLQRPHPPLYAGMVGRVGVRHAAAWADGWLPVDAGAGDMGKQIARFRVAVAEAGRDPAAVAITVMVFGDPDLARLAPLRDLGVERVVVGANRTGWTDPSTTLPFLDACAPLVEELAADR